MAEFPTTQNGRFITDGLSPEQFNRVFNNIHKVRQEKRRRKTRQLTPATLKNKNLEEILKLGKKKAGTFFTVDDLKGFQKQQTAVKKQYSSSQAGITYAQLISSSRSIDIKRANNSVEDGSGITNASYIGMAHNVATISVSASQRSEDSHHRVQIRFEEWDDALEDAAGNDIAAQQRLVRKMAKGRVSVNCDCGRYQYWYRYVATAGNFTIAPPKEYVYPKLKNPQLEGVACKHIIHALTRMQSASWHSRVLQALRKNAAGEHYGDDPQRTTEHFDPGEIKKLNRNRKSQTNAAAARAEWDKYQARLNAMAGKLTAQNKSQITKARKQLAKARTITEKEQQRRQAAKEKLQKTRVQRDQYKQQVADLLKLQKQTFIDAQVMAGKTPEQAQKAYQQHVKNKAGQ